MEAEFVDNGVGMEQVTAYQCFACCETDDIAERIAQHDEDECTPGCAECEEARFKPLGDDRRPDDSE
jgi:hypothetical protein